MTTPSYSPTRSMARRLRDARSPSKRMREPSAIAMRYARAIKSTFRTMRGLAAYGMIPLLRQWPIMTADDEDDRTEQEVLDELLDFFGDMAEKEGAAAIVANVASFPMPEVRVLDRGTIARQMGWLELVIGEWMQVETALPFAMEATGQAIMQHTHRELRRVLPIDLREDLPGIQTMIDVWRGENISLIETGPWAARMQPQLRPGMLGNVSEMVETAHAQGLRVQGLQAQLQSKFVDMPEWRAELLARDQTMKLNGQINRYRQTGAGINEYTWQCTLDSRSRDHHIELHGEVFSWHNPPEGGGTSPNEAGHPGSGILCRCQAIPVLPDWLTA